MQPYEKPFSAQDAVESFDRLRAGHVAFRFASESEAEQWDEDGRVEDAEPGPRDAPPRRP